MTKRKPTKHEDDILRNLRKSAEINPDQSPRDGIHTCSKGCRKQGCNRGLRDTIEEQDAQIEALKRDLLEKTAAVRQVAQDNKTETEATRIENARLKAENEELFKDYEAVADERRKLIDRNARLRKAGDAIVKDNINWLTDHNHIKAWNAAKEGKPTK